MQTLKDGEYWYITLGTRFWPYKYRIGAMARAIVLRMQEYKTEDPQLYESCIGQFIDNKARTEERCWKSWKKSNATTFDISGQDVTIVGISLEEIQRHSLRK